ncbi:MAG: type II toxin-antitoxin system VapC family toxin [Kouleothrix sp.]|nr:type II toxin-antitoxin system VapC family toxin [Kouleothrix sp.]
MNYLLDTNVISELVARHPNQNVVDWLDRLEPETVYLSVITIGELRKGIEKLVPSRRKDELTRWLTSDLLRRFADKIVDITADVMLVWGELTGRLEREGKSMPAIDSLIAASVLEGNFTLVTRNDNDFQHAGIPLLNPWKLE